MRRAFFDAVREMFGGRLSQKQVEGMNTLLEAWARHFSDHDPRFLAYCLATAKHETAHTMQPIREYGSDARANRLYGVEGRNPERAKKMGNTERGDGAKYKGRGYVQLTWKNNYSKAGRAVGVDLVKEPDAALEPNIAARILYQGCIEGWFTGKSLADYIGEETDYLNARRVVNGTDRANLIAGYAEQFEAAIEVSGVLHAQPDDTGPVVPPEPKGFLARILSLFNISRKA